MKQCKFGCAHKNDLQRLKFIHNRSEDKIIGVVKYSYFTIYIKSKICPLFTTFRIPSKFS